MCNTTQHNFLVVLICDAGGATAKVTIKTLPPASAVEAGLQCTANNLKPSPPHRKRRGCCFSYLAGLLSGSRNVIDSHMIPIAA
jgi:hypothetical protein